MVFVNFPKLVKHEDRKALIEWQETGFLGPGKLHGFYLDEPSTDRTFTEQSLIPIVDISEGIDGEMLRFILADRWLDKGGSEGFSMALRANVDFSSYQLRPLLKFFNEANKRILIADETGLGKTIEAGMILSEIIASKGPESCIVIMCPKSVRYKWIWELRSKFGIRANSSSFREFNEYSVPEGIHVVTHDASRQQDKIEIQKGKIDLLIIDEIHNFIGRSGNQKRRGRALDLSNASNGVIGLSATPIQLEERDLQLILDLIAPGEHSAPIWESQAKIQSSVNRVMKAQHMREGARIEDLNVLRDIWPQNLSVTPDDFLQPLNSEVWTKVEHDIRSMGPIGRRMTRARARDPDVIGPNGKPLFRERKVETHIVEKGAYSNLIDDVDVFLQKNMHFSNRRQFFSCPAAILRILNQIQTDDEKLFQLLNQIQIDMPNNGPKQEKLLDIINQLAVRNDITKTVIFTHWHPTFHHMYDILQGSEFNTFYINPNFDDKQASDVRARFSQCEGYAVLLVTDRMSEGVDLEMANSIINIDLPYNPAKLQQRIGRLDRYIQESEFIEIHNLVLKDSLEERQVEILQNRLNVFETMIGGYEAIISSNEEENEWSQDYIDSKLDGASDLHRLAESSVVLRVIDSALDNIIGEKQREIHPVHSNLYRIIKRAIEVLGGKATYDSDSHELKLVISEPLRQRLLKSKKFIPWDDGKVNAVFESVNIEGEIIIPMRGRDATFGPFDPFLIACEIMLWNIEIRDVIENEANINLESNRLIGSNKNLSRWTIINKQDRLIQTSGPFLNQIEAGEIILHNWQSVDIGHIEAVIVND